MTPRFLVFLCVFCLALIPAAVAQRNAPIGTVPPQPVDMNLKVRRDGKTEIPLRIVGKANEPLKYLIRVPPEHGRLSEPHATEREVSTVIYEPPADLGITSDKFSYAVQNSLGVSASVGVNITIVDTPAQLSFPDTLDFGKIRAGATNYRMLELSNHGGMVATGEVFVDPPWKLEGKNGYRLRAGDVAVFKITFAPEAGGTFEGVARYTSEPEHSTTLRGNAIAAISANPTRWVLQQAPGDPVRTGSFELSNQLDEPRTVHLKTDPHLKIPAEVTVPPHGTAAIIVEASPSDLQAFDTEIHLEASDLAISVPVHVPTLGPIIHSTTPEVAFGRLRQGPDANAKFELENGGGTTGTVTWEVSPPFKVTENSATLAPGEKKSFTVAIETKTPNRYRTWVHFKVGGQSFDLPVQAEVIGTQNPSSGPGPVRATRPATSAPDTADTDAPPATPTPEETQAAMLALRDSLPPDMLPTRPPPPGVQVSHITSTSATIEWPTNLSQTSRFRVEMRHIGPGPDHKLQITWSEVRDAVVEVHTPNYATTLKGLMPAQPWTVRVRPLAGTGPAGDPLFTISFKTPARATLRSRMNASSTVEFLFFVLVVLGGWQIWQRLREQRSAL